MLYWLYDVATWQFAGIVIGVLGLLDFLIAALDTPYRVEISVGPEDYERFLSRMRK